MKSGVAFALGSLFFLFGVGFYHWVILSREPSAINYHLPIIGHFHNSYYASENRAWPSSLQDNQPPNNNGFGGTLSIEEMMRGPLAQNDSRILEYIWKHNFLKEPSSPSLPYNLTNRVEDPSMGQSKMVLRALNNLRNGFFIECGALDGELRSNTLILERKFGWNGLLIEGDPKNFELLLQKNRKAWTSPSCLATKRFPHQVLFQQRFNRGRISSKTLSLNPQLQPAPEPGYALAQCFPLFSLLSALNLDSRMNLSTSVSGSPSLERTKTPQTQIVVDYFSLDVEGNELDVLKTIPWDSIDIRVISVEYVHDKGGREAVRQFMTSKGFRVFGQVNDPRRNWANDLIFVSNRMEIKNKIIS